MLLDSVLTDENDRFYFLYRFAVQSWLLFLFVIFSFPVLSLFGKELTGKQILTMCGVFFLIVVVDYLGVCIKAYPIYKEMERIEREVFGRKNGR